VAEPAGGTARLVPVDIEIPDELRVARRVERHAEAASGPKLEDAKVVVWHAYRGAEKAAFEESVWLPHRILLGTEEDVDSVVEAIAKIRASADELRAAEHRLVRLKSMSRAHRDRAMREGA